MAAVRVLSPMKPAQGVAVVLSVVVTTKVVGDIKVEGVGTLSFSLEVVGAVDVGHHNSSNSNIKEVVGVMAVAAEVDPSPDHKDNQFPSCTKLPHLCIKRCLLSLHRLR